MLRHSPTLLLYVLILVICSINFASRALVDPDTYWHIATGDLIRQSGIPEHDIWSFTAGNYRWMNISWLADIGMSVIHQAQGIPGVAKAVMLLCAMHVAWLTWLLFRYNPGIVANMAVAMVVFSCLLTGFLARPQWISFLMALGFLHILRYGKRSIWLLPPMMWFWANTHGGFIVGFMIMGAFFLEALIARDAGRIRLLVLTGGLCLISIFATPLGLDIIPAVTRTLSSPMLPLIQEWKPLNVGYPLHGFFVLLFIWVAAAHMPNIPLAERILAIAFLLMAMSHIRMLPIAATLCAPYLAIGLQERLSSSRFGEWLRRHEKDFHYSMSLPSTVRGLQVASVLATLFLLSPLPQQLAPQDYQMSEQKQLDDVIDLVLAQYPQIRFYNDYNLGGYIIYRTHGKLPVFIDGRGDMSYPNDVLYDTLSLNERPVLIGKDGPAAFDALITKYQIQGWILGRHTLLNRILISHPQWKQVHQDEYFSVLVHKDVQPATPMH